MHREFSLDNKIFQQFKIDTVCVITNVIYSSKICEVYRALKLFCRPQAEILI